MTKLISYLTKNYFLIFNFFLVTVTFIYLNNQILLLKTKLTLLEEKIDVSQKQLCLLLEQKMKDNYSVLLPETEKISQELNTQSNFDYTPLLGMLGFVTIIIIFFYFNNRVSLSANTNILDIKTNMSEGVISNTIGSKDCDEELFSNTILNSKLLNENSILQNNSNFVQIHEVKGTILKDTINYTDVRLDIKYSQITSKNVTYISDVKHDALKNSYFSQCKDSFISISDKPFVESDPFNCLRNLKKVHLDKFNVFENSNSTLTDTSMSGVPLTPNKVETFLNSTSDIVSPLTQSLVNNSELISAVGEKSTNL
jgi:hypothetical protein